MSRRTTAHRRARTVAVAAVTAAGAALLSACAPTTTALDYSPSDGVMVSVGAQDGEEFTDLRGLNLMVVSAEEGAPGTLLGALTNGTRTDATFTLAPEGATPLVFDVGAGDTLYLGGESGETVLLDVVTAMPGSSVPTVLEAGGESQSFDLPVLNGELAEYAAYVPSPAPAGSASPETSPSPQTSPSPETSASPEGTTTDE
ncbi:hypothetical protein [Myceligenerans pegani]|uniref:DNA modification methylase n=1 Tax=Myceligenerans pegani TaxID=2776917 RepID=A0ABR9MW85_9MICO|nr:hypothetical protein [Myceligenerans sp. TRM 65318]MBE1875184.1 hypothetical protein [Myceligenerans sp. TRM 65318]MBE3017455.1 hypothetical protein [Myceligenerans sp. TRM 65318]